ncbi:MAG: hypothetical protein ACI9EH_001723, partial [Planktomarina sp.]
GDQIFPGVSFQLVGRRDQASGVLFRNSAKEVSCLENTRLNSGSKSASSIALGW